MKTDIQGQTVADGRARAETDRVDSTIRPTGGQCTHGANDCEFVLAPIRRAEWFLGLVFGGTKTPPICVACIVPLYLPTKLYEYGYASGGVGEGPIVGILHLG